MGIFGPDGNIVKPDEEHVEYRIEDFALTTAQPPQFFLAYAAQAATRQMAQPIQNPFQLEPAAQGIFMLMAQALAKQAERIDALEAKLGGTDEGASDESGS